MFLDKINHSAKVGLVIGWFQAPRFKAQGGKPMKPARYFLVVPAILILVSLFAFGQSVPQLISYQGRLTNAAGIPLDGVNVDLTFAFYGVESGATPLYLTVVQNNVAVSKGIYNVLIGSGMVIPGTESDLAGVFQHHSQVWLGIKIGPDPEMIPRARITSVGYALRAGSSDSVAPGAILAANLGENCAIGEVLMKTGTGWSCASPWSNLWIWMSGSNSMDQYGNYGTKGVPAPAHVPGGRYRAVSWRDGSGNRWLFGGTGFSSSVGPILLNDLWKFDGTDWSWVSGSDTDYQYGVYGTKGVPDPANVPGGREQAVSWIDSSSNLWFFGGYGYPAGSGGPGFLNDLWKFDGTNWTWVSGSNARNQFGVYGTKGVPDPANVPGARDGAVSWIDGSGNLWLFGGWGYAASGLSGRLNDLWKFDGTDWTWVNGSNAIDQLGVYGTKGVPAPANVPGARESAVPWIDGSGNLWLFGGNGYAASGPIGDLNDLWKFDGTNWTWVSGSNAIDQYGVYGTKGFPDPAHVPGSRREAVSWRDGSGNLWLFGGWGYSTSEGLGYLNDLWKFDGTNWTWVSGSSDRNQFGVYGIKGVPDPAHVPGTRRKPVSWIDGSGDLWLFGGNGYAASETGYLNDLWKFK